jgi:hypothetical protein
MHGEAIVESLINRRFKRSLLLNLEIAQVNPNYSLATAVTATKFHLRSDCINYAAYSYTELSFCTINHIWGHVTKRKQPHVKAFVCQIEMIDMCIMGSEDFLFSEMKCYNPGYLCPYFERFLVNL